MYSKRLDNTIHDERAKDEARKVLENQRTMETDRARHQINENLILFKTGEITHETCRDALNNILTDYAQDLQDIIDFQTESIKMADKLCREKDEEINELKEVGNKVTDTLEQTFEELQKAREENERLKNYVERKLDYDLPTYQKLESELKEKTELIEKIKKCAKLHMRDYKFGTGHVEEILELLKK